jgi:hypothetical protein
MGGVTIAYVKKEYLLVNNGKIVLVNARLKPIQRALIRIWFSENQCKLETRNLFL